jgi:RimJ/RimL family protein N-acetyltransferase
VGVVGELMTERLVLRRWDPAFEESLIGLSADARVIRYIGDGLPWSEEFARQRHQAVLDHWQDHGFGWRGIMTRDGGTFIGIAAHNVFTDPIPATPPGPAVEIGWWVAPAWWGRGIATEAALALRDDAFARLGAERLVARFRPDNHASENVMRKLGMRCAGDGVGSFGTTVRFYVLDRPGE